MIAKHFSVTNAMKKLLLLITTILTFTLFLKLPSPVKAQTLTSFSFNNFTAGGAKKAGVPFPIIIYARDENVALMTSFESTINLSDSTSTIFPTQSTDFVQGVWSGVVYITEATASTAITASYNAVIDTSSTFTVDPDSRIKLLAPVLGGNQNGTVNRQLPQALTATVVDPFDNPISDIAVNFAITSFPPESTGQQLTVNAGTSDSNGQISTVLTLGRKSGTYIVGANVVSVANSTATFYETAAPDVLLTMRLTPAIAVMPAGGVMPFSVKGYDQYDNEKALGTVIWDVVGGGGTIGQVGVFTAGTTLNTYLNTVTAAYNSIGTSATVTIVEPGDGTPPGSGGQGEGGGSGGGGEEATSGAGGATPLPTPGQGTISELIVDPRILSLLADTVIPIVAEAVDILGNVVADVNFDFEIDGNLGTLTQTSANTVLLTASESGIGTITITATQGDLVKIVKVVGSVGTGLNRRLVIEDIESPQTVGEPFTISIAAKDTNNNFITDYEGPIVLADTTGTIDPEIVQPNDQGIWFVQSIISLAHPEVTVTAAGDGMVGVSNIFEVLGDPKLADIPPFGTEGESGGGGFGGGLAEILGESATEKLKDLLLDRDLNKFTIARYIGAGLAAGIGILGASLGGGIMASRGLEALGRNPFAKGRLKFNLYLGITAFIAAAGLAVFAAYLIIR